MKKLLLVGAFFIGLVSMNAQTKEELQTQKAEKQAAADALQSEANALQAQIDALPGWRKGLFGTIGGSISNFSNWYSQGTPNNASGNIGISLNAYANLIEDKFFWRNSLTSNLNWVKLDDKDNPYDDDNFNPTTDVFNISSLYGRNITKNFAVSGLAEYRTTLLDNFNDPGYLDVGVGGTWTPLENLIVVIHPLNYNFVFAENDAVFQSSLGAKIVADYTNKYGGLSLKSNLSVFQSYSGGDLSNWTFTNSFAYTIWNGLGLGFELGIRNNKQEALNNAINLNNALDVPLTQPTFSTVDNKLQSYWLFGLSYAL